MKQLETSHPLLLITIGLPGAGKSTFARQLAQTHQFAWIHANRIRHILFDQPHFTANEETLVTQLCEYMLEQALHTKGNIIYDGNSGTRAVRQRLAKVARDAGYRVLTVWVQTDADTAFSRAKKAREEEFAAALSRPLFDQFARQFTQPQINEASVVLSGKHTFVTQLRTLVRKIDMLTHPQPLPSASPKEAKHTQPIDGIHQTKPERSRPRFDITRRIKFR